MSPYPLKPVREQFSSQYLDSSKKNSQDLSSLIPFLNNPYSLLSQIVFNDKDKTAIKNIWLTSEVKDDKSIIVSQSISLRDVEELRLKGLLTYLDKNKSLVSLTEAGSKLLRESILNDETCSFTKKASKQLVSQNSYDFGDEVLIRVNHPEKFGQRYITVDKTKLAKKTIAKSINSYNIQVRKASGEYKELEEYTDAELIKVLHLAKRIIANAHNIVIQGQKLEHVPVHRIKSFAETIMKELNAR